MAFRLVTGTYRPFSVVKPDDIGVSFFFKSVPNIPEKASLWLNWRMRYSDGNTSPPGFTYITDLLDISSPNNAKGLTLNFDQDAKFLVSTQNRVLEVKGYAKRWVYNFLELPANGSMDDMIANLGIFQIDGYVIQPTLII